MKNFAPLTKNFAIFYMKINTKKSLKVHKRRIFILIKKCRSPMLLQVESQREAKRYKFTLTLIIKKVL